ncbi:MAG: hypothetical protein NUW01_06655 [Gemmatimonadaceae bacterium]|nr:hypothetical protein [Gemmatimonadaceae bacterium]
MKKAARDPFEVKLSPEKAEELVLWLSREIDAAIAARDRVVGNNGWIERAHLRYEGGEALTKQTPWPGCANLGSFLITEKVDAMRARLTSTVFTDPIWTVEGFGQAAERAPFVEMFMQWKAEATRLQQPVGRAFHNALIEGTGVLEVSDRVVWRKGIRRINALFQRDAETGAVMLDPKGQPVLVRKQDGSFEEATADEPAASMIVNTPVRASAGPSYRVVSLRDFFLLPGHAAERDDLWGYAKRVYRRLPDLQKAEKDGYYKNVADLNETGEREQTTQEANQGQDIAVQYGQTAEKEIWEVTLLADLDNDGFEEWYVVTLSILHKVLLRVQYQDYKTPHYALFVPFPRPNSVYGYPFAETKLGSLYDEHEALRNMFADRSNLATAAPLLQVEGSAWNPGSRPFGPRQVIPVRDLNEIKQLEIRDVPNSVGVQLSGVLMAAERISGMNDTTTGVQAQQDRTLGEVRLVTEQSWIRIDEVVKNSQEGMETLFDILLIVWREKLADEPEPMPSELQQALVGLGTASDDTQITAALLDGAFRGKPRGSVEASDFSKMRADFAQLLTALTQMSQAMPGLAQHLQQPNVIRSILSQMVRIYRWPDRQALLASFTGQPPAPPQLPPGALPAPSMEPNGSSSGA